MEPVLIDGTWRQAFSPLGSFSAIDPAAKVPFGDRFPVSSFADVERALRAAQKAVFELNSISPEARAEFLETFATKIEAHAARFVEIAHLETALPQEPRLRSVELPRTINQLQQAASAVAERSWCRATIDTKANLRSKYGPLGGPVIVFGPNNFPFAFNAVAGGDSASALAAGNPVIAKSNPGHPQTTKLFAELAFESLEKCGLPKAAIQLIYHLQPEDGLRLVSHPVVGATSFTGSRSSGLRLKEAADKAGKLISLEMSSVNPVFILPGALQERFEGIAGDFFNSCTLGSGQFCTKPGLVVLLEDEKSLEFMLKIKKLFEKATPGFLLGLNVLTRIESVVGNMKKHGAAVITGGIPVDSPGFCFANTLLSVSGKTFLKKPKEFEQEAFGVVSLIVFAKNKAEMLEISNALEGNLSTTVYSHSQGLDDEFYERLEPVLRLKVGRLLNDKMPTGLAVSPAMSHGGPFPATGHPGFTSVGIPGSMLRFAALHSYDHVRPHRLPPELQDKNPTGCMWRFINGEWTQRDIEQIK